MGGISYVFLRAGLLVLESESKEGATELGYFAIAFIAGLNVDNFLKKLQEISNSTWGISKKAREAEDSED